MRVDERDFRGPTVSSSISEAAHISLLTLAYATQQLHTIGPLAEHKLANKLLVLKIKPIMDNLNFNRITFIFSIRLLTVSERFALL
jgi:hypothetical protein